MSAIRAIPEVASLDASVETVRIAPETNVPLTPRVRRLVDSAEFRRLARIRQLGLVPLVYPSATHTRFEHSLGVYRLALLVLRQLSYDARFSAVVDAQLAERFVVASLLHDVGHWPFCHPIEDLRLEGVPRHERLLAARLEGSELADLIRRDWGSEPEAVLRLLSGPHQGTAERILASLLSGPIDIDKLDYLPRDSLHSGVPYGRHFDQGRLIASLCLNEAGDGLALTEKGKTAAELMVFARYVMFSEVYWHHAVRAATAMLQRAFFLLRPALDLEALFRLTDEPLVLVLATAARRGPAQDLLDGLFGPRRRLYKRVAQLSYFEDRQAYESLARRPYAVLVAASSGLAASAAAELGTEVLPHEVIIDAPPVEKEVELDIDVHFVKERRYRRLEDVSPVVRALAREQFDDYVKRVRVFAHPRVAPALSGLKDLPALLVAAAEQAA